MYKNIKFYGEVFGSDDCYKSKRDLGYCHKFNKYAFTSASGLWGAKDFHIETTEQLPPMKVKSIASFSTRVEAHNIEFNYFDS